MDTITKRHPIRGFLYGILFGLGLLMVVVGQGYAALGTWPPFIVFIVGVVAATSWSIFGPAKAPKGAPPEPMDTQPAFIDDTTDLEPAIDEVAVPDLEEPPAEDDAGDVDT